jgi:hypothetical protein
MLRKRHLAAICLSGLLLFACSALKSSYSVPIRHPEELPKGRPMCSDCHDQEKGGFVFSRFNHTASWESHHRELARQTANVCAMCHNQSFCNGCHVTTVELKPSLRDQTDTYRYMPHRGDYISRHRIDARIDPTPCFRCHGNPKSSKICVPCHG